VRQHYKDGADVIKIMPGGGVLDEGANGENPQMTIDEIKAVVAAAHDYGFTVAAHAHAAELLHKSGELGQIAPGRGADVIAVPGNPLDDITLMQHVSFVMKDGVVYKEDGKPVTFHSSAPK
jgi:imidazolonepropionase-like amidohydrolase